MSSPESKNASSDTTSSPQSSVSKVENFIDNSKITSLKDLYAIISEQKKILSNDSDDLDDSDGTGGNASGHIQLLEEQMEQIKNELNMYSCKVRELQYTLDRSSNMGTVDVGVAMENKVNQSDFQSTVDTIKEDIVSLKKHVMQLEEQINHQKSSFVDKNYFDFKMKDTRTGYDLTGLEGKIQDMVTEAVNSQIEPLNGRLEQFVKTNLNEMRKSFNTKMRMNQK